MGANASTLAVVEEFPPLRFWWQSGPNMPHSSVFIGRVWSHSEFGCEFLAKGRNPLTVDFKLRRSLDLMLVRGSGCSQQAFAFWVAGCPQKSSVQQCQSAPKFAIHVGPKT